MQTQYLTRIYIGEANAKQNNGFTYGIDEQKNSVAKWAKKHNIDGFTILPAIGYWQSQAEYTLVVEILIGAEFKITDDMLLDLKQITAQNSVLVIRQTVNAEFV